MPSILPETYLTRQLCFKLNWSFFIAKESLNSLFSFQRYCQILCTYKTDDVRSDIWISRHKRELKMVLWKPVNFTCTSRYFLPLKKKKNKNQSLNWRWGDIPNWNAETYLYLDRVFELSTFTKCSEMFLIDKLVVYSSYFCQSILRYSSHHQVTVNGWEWKIVERKSIFFINVLKGEAFPEIWS